MNDRPRRQPLLAILRSAMEGALDWRLLTLFTSIVLLTTFVAAFPAWGAFDSVFNHSPRSPAIGKSFDGLAFEDLVWALVRAESPLAGASLIAILLAALSWPLLAAMAVGAANERPRTFAGLLGEGIAYYTRMLRIGLVGLVPLGIAASAATAAYWAADRHAERATLESQATLGWRAAILGSLVVFGFFHASIELGRAAFGADGALRSGWLAWLRGVRLLVHHPLRVLGAYLGATLASYVIAFLLLVIRLRVSGPSAAELVPGFILAELAVAALGWGRAARLFAFTALSRSHSSANPTPVNAPQAIPDSRHRAPSGAIVSRSGSV